jgi:hypothetical protein
LGLPPLRKLATEAAENGWMDPTVAAGIARVRGVRRLGESNLCISWTL